MLANLSGLPVMQQAVVLREVLGPAPGLRGADRLSGYVHDSDDA
jgi:hypothetical protein